MKITVSVRRLLILALALTLMLALGWRAQPITAQTNAQADDAPNLAGPWRGTLHQQADGPGETARSYAFSLQLTQIGRTLGGSSRIDVIESGEFGQMRLTGRVTNSGAIYLQETEIIAERWVTDEWDWCIKTLVLSYEAESGLLSGTWEGWAGQPDNECTPGTVELQRIAVPSLGVSGDDENPGPLSGGSAEGVPGLTVALANGTQMAYILDVPECDFASVDGFAVNGDLYTPLNPEVVQGRVEDHLRNITLLADGGRLTVSTEMADGDTAAFTAESDMLSVTFQQNSANARLSLEASIVRGEFSGLLTYDFAAVVGGVASGWSVTGEITCPLRAQSVEAMRPYRPTNVRINQNAAGALVLTWDAPQGPVPVTGYVVTRSLDVITGSFDEVARVNVAAFVDDSPQVLNLSYASSAAFIIYAVGPQGQLSQGSALTEFINLEF